VTIPGGMPMKRWRSVPPPTLKKKSRQVIVDPGLELVPQEAHLGGPTKVRNEQRPCKQFFHGNQVHHLWCLGDVHDEHQIRSHRGRLVCWSRVCWSRHGSRGEREGGFYHFSGLVVNAWCFPGTVSLKPLMKSIAVAGGFPENTYDEHPIQPCLHFTYIADRSAE